MTHHIKENSKMHDHTVPDGEPCGSANKRSLSEQIIRFGVVGVVGFVINAGMVAWLAHSIGPVLAQVMAFPVAVSVTWLLNRQYTFGVSQHVWHREWMHYITGNTLGWITNNGIYFFLILKIPEIYQNPSIAVAAGSLAGMTFNFIISKIFIFKC